MSLFERISSFTPQQTWSTSVFISGDSVFVVVALLLSRVPLLVIPWTVACRTSLSFTISQSLLRFMSIKSMMLANHLILCHLLLLLPSIFPSIRVFCSEPAYGTISPKHWNFSFSISLSNEYSGLTPLGLTDLISLLAKGLSGGFSSTTIQKHQFFNTQPSLWFISHIHTWLLEKPQLWLYGPLSAVMSLLFKTLSRSP